MRVELQDDGVLVSGYLDTGEAGRGRPFDTVLVRGSRPYRDEVRAHRLGALNACDISGCDQVSVLPRASPSAPVDRHLLGLLLAGRATLEQDGRLAALSPGDFVLYRGSTWPFRLELSGPFRYFLISMDEATAGFLRHAGPATANPELPRFASGRILAAALAEIAGLAARMGPLTRQEMGEHITGMLRTVIREASRREPGAPAARVAVFERVLAYIDRNLGGELSPESVAAAQHLSVRSLHALFRQHDDTLGQHVRRRRLDRIRRDLADPGLAHLPGYAVAARWGIRNPSHFSKVFRAEFGLSPQELRRQARRGRGADVTGPGSAPDDSAAGEAAAGVMPSGQSRYGT